MADHWNFLANLLGAPGSAAPPPKKEEQPEPVAEPEVEVENSSIEDESQEDECGTVDKSAHPVAEKNISDQGSHDSDNDVLDALKKVVPEPTVPGFVAETGDADEATDGGAEDNALDAAWGDLASELGVDPESAPAPRPKPASEAPPRRAKEDRQSRPTKKRSSGGFGTGLGLDLGPEPEVPQDEQPSAESIEREPDSRPDRTERGRQSESRSDREPRGDRESEDRPRGRSRGPRDDRADESAGGGSDGGRGRGSDGGEEEERPRRRGRRGVRQRMSEADADQVASDGPRSSTSEDADTPRSGRKPRGERSDRDERSGRDDAPPRRSSRDSSFDGPEDDVDEFDTGLVTKRDPETSEDDDAPRSRPRRDQETSEDGDAPRSRSRRRGGRGRGRGRGSRGGDDSVSRDDNSSRDDSSRGESDARAERPLQDGLAAFDDDHEDDAEVEVIRRGQQRGRSRPEEGRDGEDRGPRRGRERGGADRSEGDGPRRPRRGRDDADEEAPKRRNVPTWLETVEILVNANIENHKKTPRGGRGRGGKRRS